MSEQSRKELAKLSFSEKIKILDKLRRRSLAIARAGLRKDRKTRVLLGMDDSQSPRAPKS